MNLLFYTLMRFIKRAKFKHLFQTYRLVMFQSAYAILGSESLAEAALCNAFSIIIPYLDRLPKCNTRKTEDFLLLVVKYASFAMQGTVYDKHVHIEKESAVSLDSSSFSAAYHPAQLSEAISKLEPIAQDLLTLLYLYDLTLNDVALILHITPQTAEALFQAAIHFCSSSVSSSSAASVSSVSD